MHLQDIEVAGAPGSPHVESSTAELAARTKRALNISAVVCVATAIVLWAGPNLMRVDLFDGDATQHVFWLYRYADPELFPGDPSVEYFASLSVAPWGYRAIYALIAPLGDVLFAAEAVSVLLLIAAALLAWLLGTAMVTGAPPLAGLLALTAMLALLPGNDLLPPMGFQRTFALPITLLCLWALVARRYAWVGVSWIAAALFYPVLIPVLGLAAVIVFLVDLVRERRMPRLWPWNAAMGIAALAIAILGSGTPEGLGPMVSYEQARHMPEFGPEGRQSLFGTSWVGYWFRHHRTGLGWSPWAVLSIAVAVLGTVALGRRRLIPLPAWILAATGLLLWLLARQLLFLLYLPNRHSRYSLAAFAIVAFAAAAYAVIQALASRPHPRPTGINRLSWAAAIVAPLVVTAQLLPSAVRAWERPVDPDLERAYAFIATLPPDTLVAAHPDLADPIPLRTRRSVLASTEESIAFMQGYYAHMRPRLEASLRAAYATSWSELDAALDAFDVDVMLTAPVVWTKSGYYAPFDTLVQQLREAGKQRGFVLQDPPQERILFRSGDVYVVRVGAAR